MLEYCQQSRFAACSHKHSHDSRLTGCTPPNASSQSSHKPFLQTQVT
jgi:hypothetical protein